MKFMSSKNKNKTGNGKKKIMFEKRACKFKKTSYVISVIFLIIMLTIILFQIFYASLLPSKLHFSWLAITKHNFSILFLQISSLCILIFTFIFLFGYLLFISKRFLNGMILKTSFWNWITFFFMCVFYFLIPNIVILNFFTPIMFLFFSLHYQATIT